MMIANVFAGLVALAWGLVLWIGINGLTAISRLGIVGAPTARQTDWYLWRPVEVLTILMVTATISNWFRLPVALLVITACALAFLLHQTLELASGV